MNVFAVGRYDIYPKHVFARHAQLAPVPPKAALQQIPTHAHAFAMPRRKKQILLKKLNQQRTPAHAWPYFGGHGFAVDFVLIKTFHVDKNAVISHVIGTPTMPS